MANSTTVPFQPTTDTFGQLTINSHPVRRTGMPKNLLIALSFVLAFGAAAAGLLAIDNAIFENAQHDGAASSSVHLDYD